MENKQKLKKINDFIKGTMVSALDIKITDVGDDYVTGEMPVNNNTKYAFNERINENSIKYSFKIYLSYVSLLKK